VHDTRRLLFTTLPGDMTTEIRMATRRDVPEMVAISNSYVDATHINFAVEPESIEA